MSYCRKCGAKLDEDARFCRVCGAPVEFAAPDSHIESTRRRARRSPFIIPFIVLAVVLAIIVFFAALFLVPFIPVDYSQTFEVPSVSGIDSIDLSFQANAADVNIIPTELQNQYVKMDVYATGSVGILGSSTQPVTITFNNETAGNVLRISSTVSRREFWPASFNLKVTCDVYVDNSKTVNINSETSVGELTLTPERQVSFQGLTLHSSTGGVQANLNDLVEVNGDVSISTTTGSIQFTLNNAGLTKNPAIDLTTTTGSVNLDIMQNRAFSGNVSVKATTTTGSVSVGTNISGDIGAMITSQTSLGSISVDVQSFNGNKSPIYSSNYPAAGNFVVDSKTTTGSIHITASYVGSTSNNQEQVRDNTMSFIRQNHPETSQFMNYQNNWTGGRVNIGLLGSETYIYTNAGWNVTLKYPVTPNPIYTISADYSAVNKSNSPTIPYRVIWTGTWQSGVITETDYVFAQ